MNEPKSLGPWDAGAPPVAVLRGTALATREVLRSPASGNHCVHWRLRVHESMMAGVELVHEVMAPEPFDISWKPEPNCPARLVRLCGERVRIQAHPTWHAEGSPGALEVARHFGFSGKVRVEEVLLRPGATLEAQGLLFDPEAMPTGPYRGHQGTAELFEATVRMPTGIALRPALLPWALGTAAALLTAAGATAAIAKLQALGLDVPVPAAIGAAKPPRRPLWP